MARAGKASEIDELKEKLAERDRTVRRLRERLKEVRKDGDDSEKRKSLRSAISRLQANRDRASYLLGSGTLTAAEQDECRSIVAECDRVLAKQGGAAKSPRVKQVPPRHMLVKAGLVSNSRAVSERVDGVLRLNTACTPEEARARLAEMNRELGR